MATVQNPSQYSYQQEVGLNEPISRSGSLELPKYDPRNNYFQAYWKLYSGNEQMMAQINEFAEERDQLLKAILQVEQYYNDEENLERLTRERYLSGRKKHIRRCANEIRRALACPYAKCSKSYASEGSLNLHIKLKHNGGNKTDREKIAKSIVFAKANGMTICQELALQVNLPPGIIEKAAEQLGVELDNQSIDTLETAISKTNEEQRIKQKQEELIRAQKYPAVS